MGDLWRNEAGAAAGPKHQSGDRLVFQADQVRRLRHGVFRHLEIRPRCPGSRIPRCEVAAHTVIAVTAHRQLQIQRVQAGARVVLAEHRHGELGVGAANVLGPRRKDRHALVDRARVVPLGALAILHVLLFQQERSGYRPCGQGPERATETQRGIVGIRRDRQAITCDI